MKQAQKKKTTKPKGQKEGAKPASDPQDVATCSLKDMAKVILDHEGVEIRASGKWALVVDPTERARVFLSYRNANCLCALNRDEMEPARVRMALLGAIRFGKPFVIDMMDGDMFQTISDVFNGIRQGLMDDVMSKIILKEEKYMELVEESDPEEYQPTRFEHHHIENFQFIMTSKVAPQPQLAAKMFVLTITD